MTRHAPDHDKPSVAETSALRRAAKILFGCGIAACGLVAMTACTDDGYVAGVRIDPTHYTLSEFDCAARVMDTNVDGSTVRQEVWWGRAEITNTLDRTSPHYSILYRVEFANGEVKEGFGEAVFPLAPGESAPISTSIGLVDSTPTSCELEVQDSPFNY